MKKPDQKAPPTSVRLSEELTEAIKTLAANDRRSVSTYIELVLEEHVKKTAPKLLKTKRD